MSELLVFIAALYALICGLLPLAIGRRRGLRTSQLRIIAVAGLAFGWTGYGALLAWLAALTDDPHDGALLVTLR